MYHSLSRFRISQNVSYIGEYCRSGVDICVAYIRRLDVVNRGLRYGADNYCQELLT